MNCEHPAEGLHGTDAYKSKKAAPEAKEVMQHHVPTAWLWLELLLCLTLQSYPSHSTQPTAPAEATHTGAMLQTPAEQGL